MNMDGQDVQDDFNSTVDSPVSCESFGFEFRMGATCLAMGLLAFYAAS